MNNELSIYIHVPFCKSKCSYCDFVSYEKSEDLIEEYFKALYFEIEQYQIPDEISSIYFGGGTPGYVNEKYIAGVLERLNNFYSLRAECEISLEINPGVVSYEKLSSYKESGINRISMGMQSANDEILKKIGRIHTHSQTIEAVELIKKSGINNFNLDLMFSLPTQTLEDVKAAVDFAKESTATHISAYSLILEENTPIYKKYKSGEFSQDDDLDRAMYHLICQELSAGGFERYEISNFAHPGFECRHNLNCWSFCDYLGFGAASHSFVGNKRFVNNPDIKKYIKGVYENRQVVSEISESSRELMGDYIMLSFRKASGINLRDFYERFEVGFEEKFKKEIEFLITEGLILKTQCGYALTNRGFDFESAVAREFI